MENQISASASMSTFHSIVATNSLTFFGLSCLALVVATADVTTETTQSNRSAIPIHIGLRSRCALMLAFRPGRGIPQKLSCNEQTPAKRDDDSRQAARHEKNENAK